MRKLIFILGFILLVFTILESSPWSVKTNTIVIFVCLTFLVLFDDLDEFNLLGMLRGKRAEKRLKELSKTIDTHDQATSTTTSQEDDLTKLRQKSINLMSVDRGNLLALIFEIERLLRLVAIQFYPDQVNEKNRH
ncbi:MAG: hypothetical protein ACREHC_00120 [Candidatus Levyibacteriota bacterium]